jgi:glycosyltransferase involved in cell wall biosynthesis
MKKFLFWGSLGLVLYTYVGFPLVVLLRGLVRQRPVTKADITPSVSMIIAVYNEAASIGAKLDNALSLDYPPEQLEIIVASDGSNDRTDEIVAGYADPRITFLDLPRMGKIPALNIAAAHAAGEILVFSDATSIFAIDALRALVRPFADPDVGAVGGVQYYGNGGGAGAATIGERLYWSFDGLLKRMQSQAGNMIAAGGAIYTIRRELYQPVPPGVGDDFVISTRAIAQGYRLVCEPAAVSSETIASSDRAEFRRKVRVIDQGLRGLWAVRELFNPLRYGFYAVQIFSHKLLRWSVPWQLLVLLGVSPGLWRAGRLYRLAALGQLALYGSALGALLLRRTPLAQRRAFKLLAIPYYFCMVNVASLHAWLRLLSGRRIDMWDSAERGTRPRWLQASHSDKAYVVRQKTRIFSPMVMVFLVGGPQKQSPKAIF